MTDLIERKDVERQVVAGRRLDRHESRQQKLFIDDEIFTPAVRLSVDGDVGGRRCRRRRGRRRELVVVAADKEAARRRRRRRHGHRGIVVAPEQPDEPAAAERGLDLRVVAGLRLDLVRHREGGRGRGVPHVG